MSGDCSRFAGPADEPPIRYCGDCAEDDAAPTATSPTSTASQSSTAQRRAFRRPPSRQSEQQLRQQKQQRQQQRQQPQQRQQQQPRMMPRQRRGPPSVVYVKPWYNKHSVGGILFLLCTATDICRFMTTRQPSILFRLANLGLAIHLYLGSFRAEIQEQQAPLGLMLNRLGSWNVAFVGLSMSMYTTSGVEWLAGEVHLINMIGTFIFPLALLDSMTIFYEEVRHGHIFLQGFVVENLATFCILLTLPLFRLCYGAESMTNLYGYHPMAETVYVVSLFSAVAVSIESCCVCLVSAGKLDTEIFNDITTVLWGLIYAPGAAMLVGYWNGIIAGALYYAVSFCIFFFGTFVELNMERRGWLTYRPLKQKRRKGY